MNPIRKASIQAARIKIKSNNRNITICAIYCPPRYSISSEEYIHFFEELGSSFIVGGDFNAKHPWWGSRLINPKGRELFNCISIKNYCTLSTGRPTYWPTDPNKVPDLMDFAVFHGIPSNVLDITESDELFSDHSALVILYNSNVHTVSNKYRIVNEKTDIKSLQFWLEDQINLNCDLNSGHELDTVIDSFTNLIHEAAALSTPLNSSQSIIKNNSSVLKMSLEIGRLVKEKRRLRRFWKNNRNPTNKRNLNKITKELKECIAIEKNKGIQDFLKNLAPSNHNDHRLWQATKYLKRPCKRNILFKNIQGIWCRSDITQANAFADHLEKVFQPFQMAQSQHTHKVREFLNSPCQLDLPIKKFKVEEVREEIKKLKNTKTPGFDGITPKIAKLLPPKALILLTEIYNAIIRLNHFPTQWKCAEIIMIPKPNKPDDCITSYRPISLLSLFSKIFEKIFLIRLMPTLSKQNILPDHQFGFRAGHGTPEQCHRIINTIRNALENKKYCSSVFLDVQQAFDRVWHDGLLYKIKFSLPAPYFLFFRSYLSQRSFYVKIKDERSKLCQINAGIPQGSVLGPILYTIYTADIPINSNLVVATYADDTAILATHDDPSIASTIVQNHLIKLEQWLVDWNIKINSEKSRHVTFTMRRQDCPKLFIHQKEIPQHTSVKYLGLHLDRRLTWREHISAKRKQLNIKNRKMNWLIGKSSELSIESKILLYKVILKSIWTYGIQLWGTASNSNIEILQRFQSKCLRNIANAPWYMRNTNIHKDLNIPLVIDEIKKFSVRYLDRLHHHGNVEAILLLDESSETHRLKKWHILELPFRS